MINSLYLLGHEARYYNYVWLINDKIQYDSLSEMPWEYVKQVYDIVTIRKELYYSSSISNFDERIELI